MIDLVEYSYHAVGQGLFSTGALIKQGRIGPRFRWAYDCGTVSGQALITRGMDEIAWPNPGTLQFDLMAISHFDADHISGMADFLARFPVRMLLLPYATLAARLAVAFAQNVAPSDQAIRLFIDPIGFIRSLEGGDRIEQIVLVPPSGEEGPPPPILPEGPDEPGGPTAGEKRVLNVEIDLEKPGEELIAELLIAQDPVPPSVSVLSPGGRIRVAQVWEFVPYNNAELLTHDLSEFQAAVSEIRSDLLSVAASWQGNASPPSAVTAEVKKLKALYDREFGKTAKKRNLISLFLYSGPTFPLKKFRDVAMYTPHGFHGLRHRRVRRIAQLFTGDGYLDTPVRLDALTRYLAQERVGQIGIFQVMHHGARSNWHKGVADRLKPLLSVFSSDPARANTFHPHAEVLRDFWPYGAAQADLDRSVEVTIHLD